MKTKVKDENVKMNLTVPKEFADLLTIKAHNDYLKTSTWVKRFLMKHILPEADKQEKNSMNSNVNRMEN